YTEVTYPHLTRLFAALDVPTEPSDMSFGFSAGDGLEYGANLRGLLAQPGRLLSQRYRSMLRDIGRFRRMGAYLTDVAGTRSITELLDDHGFTDGFIDDYLVPMTGAIWSASAGDIRRYPAAVMLRFLGNHGLIDIVGRPRWRTVTGGSRQYVDRLTAGFSHRIRASAPVTGIARTGRSVTVESRFGLEEFDHVIFATHTDQALHILGSQATGEEIELLGAIRYQPNSVYLHSDPALMPRRRAAWASWNAFADEGRSEDRAVSVTYWMNRLQNLATSMPILVSLNPLRPPRPDLVHGSYTYAHPQFDAAAIEAQKAIASIQGRSRTWFAGAYLGYGFHEDGLQSGLNVAAALGSAPPWFDDVVAMSSAPPARVGSLL
ncbi:MAG: NAD/FAD-binding protein, partial [Acidimicrobiia bacterium]|nr:NAD/FAD-binding protein [Acidimicrobiia bacterium]